MKRTPIYSLILLGFSLIFIPAIVYFLTFKSNGISKDPAHWADFSEYWSVFINFANLIIISLLSFIVFKYDQHRNYESEKREITLDRPLLAFIKNREGIYFVKNIGKGAAINIILKSNYSESSQSWEYTNLLYSLKENDMTNLTWVKQSSLFIAKYEDIFGNIFYSHMKDDKMTFAPESELQHRLLENIQILFNQ